MIVKAEWEHGSLGLDETSVMPCEDASHIIVARTLLHRTDHFAEAYIEGREFHLSLLERVSGVEVLPITEILFWPLASHANVNFRFGSRARVDFRKPEPMLPEC